MVKCADCGLLYALTANGQTVEQVSEKIRLYGSSGGWEPYCAARQPLNDEWRELHSRIHREARDGSGRSDETSMDRTQRSLAEVFARDRPECRDVFVGWRPGLTIGEHQEMLDRQWMLDREDRRDAAMNRREDEKDARMNRREDERDEAVKGRHLHDLWVLGGGVVLATLIAGCMALVAGLISAGWIPAPPWVQDDGARVVVVIPTPAPQSTPSTAASPTP